MNKRKALPFCLFIIMFIQIILVSCSEPRMLQYYSQEENYVYSTGHISYINYNESTNVIYLGFSDLTPTFDDNCFKIVGDNVPLVKENGIDDKIEIGSKVEFITAPKYFGDGYVMPIVAITVNNEILLDFDIGWNNLLKWLKSN